MHDNNLKITSQAVCFQQGFTKLTMMATVFVIFASILIKTKSQFACANEESYCLSGLQLNDFNDLICTQYLYQGTINDCSYYKSIDVIYLYWNLNSQSWLTANNVSNNTAYALLSTK